MDYEKRSGKYCVIKPWFVTSGIIIRRLARDIAEDTIWSRVHLSTLIIGEYVWYALHVYLQCKDPTPNPWWARNSLPPELMSKAGWCPSLSVAFLDEEVPQSFMYYISRIDRRDVGINHADCTSKYCTLDRLDVATYRTKHAEYCGESVSCPDVSLEPSRWTELLKIIDEKQVPLITVHWDGSEAEPSIEVISSEDNPVRAPVAQEKSINVEILEFQAKDESIKTTVVKPYVCISHVWSE